MEKSAKESVGRFWREILKSLAFWMGLATLAGWGFGVQGLVIAWWGGATIFFVDFLMRLHAWRKS